MKIIQIEIGALPKWHDWECVYGLGDDNNVYVWQPITGEWKLFTTI
jgi:hypothetical protein